MGFLPLDGGGEERVDTVTRHFHHPPPIPSLDTAFPPPLAPPCKGDKTPGRGKIREPRKSCNNFFTCAGMATVGILMLGGASGCSRTLSPTPKACTQESKQCPDGSYVGRTGKNCEFTKCPTINPVPATECTKDSDCPSSQYICQELQGTGTACPSTDPSCVPTHTIIKGECKLKEGNPCGADADCVAGNLCHKNICVSPVGRQCSGPSDTSCPADFECVAGCGPPVVRYPDDTPPTYFCQLKGYDRPCPICLAENTLIATPQGPIPIQQLQKGMAIWTLNEFGDHVSAMLIETAKTPVPSTHQVIHLTLDDGREIFASPGHPTADNRTAGDLSIGDLLDGGRVVTATKVRYQKGFTYDILPAGVTGLYWANGILLGSTLR